MRVLLQNKLVFQLSAENNALIGRTSINMLFVTVNVYSYQYIVIHISGSEGSSILSQISVLMIPISKVRSFIQHYFPTVPSMTVSYNVYMECCSSIIQNPCLLRSYVIICIALISACALKNVYILRLYFSFLASSFHTAFLLADYVMSV